MEKQQIRERVIELMQQEIERKTVMLDKILEYASQEELDAPGAICDIYTCLMEDSARQLATNPRQYSQSVHRMSRRRVRRFWWLAQH